MKLLKAAMLPRDKALLWAIFEVGPRPCELLSPQIKDITFDEYGIVMNCTGKTGFTRYRLIPSAKYIAVWLDHHPLRDDPEAPLWPGMDVHRPLTPYGLRKMLVKMAKAAGIDKRIFPYIFRHRDATVRSDWMNEFQLKEQKNWSQGSRMAAVYIHRSGKNLDNIILRKFGFESKEEARPEYELPMCTRCKERNPPTASFCFRCGFPMDSKFFASQGEFTQSQSTNGEGIIPRCKKKNSGIAHTEPI